MINWEGVVIVTGALVTCGVPVLAWMVNIRGQLSRIAAQMERLIERDNRDEREHEVFLELLSDHGERITNMERS